MRSNERKPTVCKIDKKKNNLPNNPGPADFNPAGFCFSEMV